MKLINTLIALVVLLAPAAAQSAPLKVCATVTDLGSLVTEIGGPDVNVVTFAKGVEDAHFIEARPSFVKELSTADLLVVVGMDLEEGWVPPLLQNARNGRVLRGANGYLDASRFVQPMEVPTAPVDRSMGHVHAAGNPHYLVDPLNGLKVAAGIRDRLSLLRAGSKDAFASRYEAFKKRIGEALVGAELARRYDFEKLALLHEHGKLKAFLERRKEADVLGGWLGTVVPHFGIKAVSDHNLWPYFARRFGIVVTAYFEPLPGVPPTTRHVAGLIKQMQADGVRLILSAPYFDPKHAEFAASRTGARIAALAHQVGARPGTSDYVSMVDWNVREVARALSGG